MSKRKIIWTQCRRCGTSISVLDRSLFGADQLKAELGNICGVCITPEEERLINEEMLRVVLRELTGVVAE